MGRKKAKCQSWIITRYHVRREKAGSQGTRQAATENGKQESGELFPGTWVKPE